MRITTRTPSHLSPQNFERVLTYSVPPACPGAIAQGHINEKSGARLIDFAGAPGTDSNVRPPNS